jgi:hypothetical protein
MNSYIGGFYIDWSLLKFIWFFFSFYSCDFHVFLTNLLRKTDKKKVNKKE